MDWQLLLVGMIVTGAACYLARQTWRTWTRSKTGCGGGCGCGSKTAQAAATNGHFTLIPAEQLSLRRRKPDNA